MLAMALCLWPLQPAGTTLLACSSPPNPVCAMKDLEKLRDRGVWRDGRDERSREQSTREE
jgi:hypothetical protein